MPLAVTPQVHCSWAVVEDVRQRLSRISAELADIATLLSPSLQVGICRERVGRGTECKFEWVWWKASVSLTVSLSVSLSLTFFPISLAGIFCFGLLCFFGAAPVIFSW